MNRHSISTPLSPFVVRKTLGGFPEADILGAVAREGPFEELNLAVRRGIRRHCRVNYTCAMLAVESHSGRALNEQMMLEEIVEDGGMKT